MTPPFHTERLHIAIDALQHFLDGIQLSGQPLLFTQREMTIRCRSQMREEFHDYELP
jgi:hypothetical protein